MNGDVVTNFKASVINSGMFAAIFGDKLDAVIRMVETSGLTPVEPFTRTLKENGRLEVTVEKANVNEMAGPGTQYSATFTPKE